MSTPTIFQAVDNQKALIELIEEMDGDVSDATIEEYVSSLVAEITSGLAKKVDGYSSYIKSNELIVGLLKEKEAEAKKKRQAVERTIERLKDNLKYAMTQLGKDILEGEKENIVMSSPASCIKVIVDNEAVVPATFVRTKVVTDIDKMSIKAALVLGEKVEGCHLERGFQIKSVAKK